MMKWLRLLALMPGLLLANPAAAQDDRDYPRIIAAPEVLVYAADVADAVARTGRRKFPELQHSTVQGSIRTFCSNSREAPDLLLLSLARGSHGIGACETAEPVLRMPFGHQVLVAYGAPGTTPMRLTIDALYRAIARDIPDPAGSGDLLSRAFIANPYQRWNQIDPALPDAPIHLVLPPQRALQWLTIETLVMMPACLVNPAMQALQKVDDQAAVRRCLARRTDGVLHYADGEAYAAQPALLPTGDAIALNERRALDAAPGVALASIDGVLPDDQSIIAATYPLTTTVSAVVKSDRLDSVPNLRNFLLELLSPEAAGPQGYLRQKGLDPLPAQDLRRSNARARYGQE